MVQVHSLRIWVEENVVKHVDAYIEKQQREDSNACPPWCQDTRLLAVWHFCR